MPNKTIPELPEIDLVDVELTHLLILETAIETFKFRLETLMSLVEENIGGIAYSQLVLTGAILNADLAAGIDAVKIGGGAVSNAEFAYLDGVTSAIQTQIDNLTQGIKWKAPVRVASTANLTLSGTQTVDGVAVIAGDRVLAKDQSSGATNGIYVVAAGAWSRSTDADTAAEVTAATTTVAEGTINADRGFRQTVDSITLGSTAQTWVQIFGAGTYTADGLGLELTGSTFGLELDGTSLAKSATGLKVNISGAPVGTTDALVLTAKDYDGGTASNTSRLTVPKAALATLTALTRKQGTLVYDTTANALLADDGTNLNQIGGGSGEKNYITAPNTATGWTAVGDFTLSTSSTAAELPREYTTRTGIKLVAASGTQSAADYIYFDFTLDDVDLSKKLKIQWAQKIVATFAATNLAVVITSQADRTTALHTPVTTAIPAADGVFTTSFDAGTTATLSLVIRGTAVDMTTGDGIVISDVIVGPGTKPQGAVVGPATSWTPTLNAGFGTTTLVAFSYQRVGEYMEINGLFKTGTVTTGVPSFSLPSGLTLNTSLLTSQKTRLGAYNRVDGTNNINTIGITGANSRQGVLGYGPTAGATGVTFFVNTAATTVLDENNASSIFANNEVVILQGRVPIAEWSGSGTVNLAQNEIEYASVGGTWDADSSTTVYGPGGSLMGGALAASREKTITWQTNVQATDRVQIWASKDQVNWMPINGSRIGSSNDIVVPGVTSAGSVLSGAGVYWRPGASANQTIITIARYMNIANDDAPVTDWPSSAAYWVATKSAAGQAVGFGLATGTSAGLLSYYQEDDTTLAAVTFAGNLGGSAGAAVAIKITRIGRIVSLFIDTGTCTPTTSSASLNGSIALPTWARPSATRTFITQVKDNGSFVTTVLGELDIGTDGILKFYRTTTGVAYTNSAVAGWVGFTATYMI